MAERERLGHGHHESPSIGDGERFRALLAAGFAETGVLWRHGDDRLLAAVR
jgi:hypothetical protein